ncbi:MAG: hypothetical protein V7K39_28780, partial [Nostoc sp.]
MIFASCLIFYNPLCTNLNSNFLFLPRFTEQIQILHVYELRGTRYFETSETWLEQVGLGITLWEGKFEDRQDTWLRWCYQDGNILSTGDERAEQERQRAEQERERAEQAEQRTQLLADRLRAMGVDPDTL